MTYFDGLVLIAICNGEYFSWWVVVAFENTIVKLLFGSFSVYYMLAVAA